MNDTLDLGTAAVVSTPAAPVMGQPATIDTMVGTRKFTLASDDNYLQHIGPYFEPEMVQLFTSLLRPEDVVLDVGANIGCTTLLFAQLARRVFSFEPSPSTFAFLQANVEAAGFDNIVPVNLGMGHQEGVFELTFAADNRSGGFVSNRITASQGHNVERIAIAAGDAWIAQAGVERVDFIKIDVEGFERNVIEGLADTIARDRPVVVLELNHWCLNVFQRTSIPDFFDFLRGVFPVLYAVDGPNEVRDLHNTDHAYDVMYQHVVNNFRYANLVGGFDRARMASVSRVLGY